MQERELMGKFNMLEEDDLQDTGQHDEFGDIRKKFEQAEIDKKLKCVFFGGYSRKNVNEIIDAYKDMVRWMQDNFEYQMEEIQGEKERLINERGVLKKQLDEELEKSKEVVHIEQQLGEWEEKHDRLKTDYEKTAGELEQMKEKHEALRQDYEKLKEKHKKLMTNRQKEQETGGSKKLVCQLTGQLESLSNYCITLEKQHADLETQLSSMRTISRELEKITSEHEKYKKELQECQRRYLDARRENTGLGKELETARTMMEEVLEQFNRKETEAGILKQNLKTCKQQLIEALKAKLEQQTENFEMLEQLYKLEHETKEGHMCKETMRMEMEEMAEKCRQMDEDKIIRLSGPDIRENSEDDMDSRKIREILERAQQLTERLARLSQSGSEGNEKPCTAETLQEVTGNAEIS